MHKNKDMMLRIQKRRDTLKKVGIELKSHFVGLDKIIDDILRNVEVWYVLPEILQKNRPTIINLWGLTGVGKTDLVRRFVKLIGYSHKFCEIQLTNKGDAARPFESTISSILSSSPNIKSSDPCILLMDEIQRFRTIGEDGMELHDYKFQDIWSLLSDGKLPFEADMNYLLGLLFDYSKDEIKEKQNSLLSKSGKLNPKFLSGSKNTKPSDPNYEHPSPGISRGALGEAHTHPIEDDFDDDGIYVSMDEYRDPSAAQRNSEFFTNYYCLERFKKILRLTEPIEEIALWDKEKKKQIISERLNDASFYEEEDYSKLLIFVSGNLDEAYQGQAHKTEEVDIDADAFHKDSLKINILGIKTALKSKFKPEQIARFGNIHIIYPSLSKKSYQKIIHRKITETTNDVYKRFQIKIKIDGSIEDLIYHNGVYPTQGTRPVFSTIGEVVDSNIPQFLFHAFMESAQNIDMFYENKKICANIGGKTYKVPYVGSIDNIKNERGKNLDKKTLVSVHEAGHSVVYAVLFGISPTQMNANPASNSAAGFVGSHGVDHSEKLFMNRITSSMGGLAAEEIVFGIENKYEGAAGDIQVATSVAAGMVRQMGMKGSHVYVSQNTHYMDSSYTDFARSNEEINKIVAEGKEEARKILFGHLDLLRDVTERLVDKGFILPKDFKDMCAKHGLKIKIRDLEDVIAPEYVSLYNKFKKGK